MYTLKNPKDTVSIAGFPNISGDKIDQATVELMLEQQPASKAMFLKDGKEISEVKVERGEKVGRLRGRNVLTVSTKEQEPSSDEAKPDA